MRLSTCACGAFYVARANHPEKCGTCARADEELAQAAGAGLSAEEIADGVTLVKLRALRDAVIDGNVTDWPGALRTHIFYTRDAARRASGAPTYSRMWFVEIDEIVAERTRSRPLVGPDDDLARRGR